MFEVEIDGKPVKAEVTFYTAVLYEEEFRSDIIKDFFGVQETSEIADEHLMRIDFTKMNWSAAMKVLWAAVKTADPAAPNYTAWMKNAKGVNLWLARELVGMEIADCFFRASAAEEGDEEQ